MQPETTGQDRVVNPSAPRTWEGSVVNTSEILKERERLSGIVAEARVARAKIGVVNRLIVLYGENIPESALETSEPEVSALVCPFALCLHEFRSMHGVVKHLKSHDLSDADRAKLVEEIR